MCIRTDFKAYIGDANAGHCGDETNTQELGAPRNFGLLVHDNNASVAKKHTELMRHFHQQGTLWRQIDGIIETPLFVDSRLTRMVQIADLCAYSLRRFVENGEMNLFQTDIRSR